LQAGQKAVVPLIDRGRWPQLDWSRYVHGEHCFHASRPKSRAGYQNPFKGPEGEGCGGRGA